MENMLLYVLKHWWAFWPLSQRKECLWVVVLKETEVNIFFYSREYWKIKTRGKKKFKFDLYSSVSRTK
jgi:hypothetical protein